MSTIVDMEECLILQKHCTTASTITVESNNMTSNTMSKIDKQVSTETSFRTIANDASAAGIVTSALSIIAGGVAYRMSALITT